MKCQYTYILVKGDHEGLTELPWHPLSFMGFHEDVFCNPWESPSIREFLESPWVYAKFTIRPINSFHNMFSSGSTMDTYFPHYEMGSLSELIKLFSFAERIFWNDNESFSFKQTRDISLHYLKWLLQYDYSLLLFINMHCVNSISFQSKSS